MAQVRVRWLQRANGRYPGHEEVIENTPYVDALLANRRLEIVEHLPIVGVFIPAAEPEPIVAASDVKSVIGNDLGQVLDDYLGEEPAPKPKPRPRRRPVDEE